MNEDIIGKVNSDLEDYNNNEVVIADKYKFRQKETIKDNLRTYNSQFKKGNKDEAGFQKFFKNIVKNPCTVTTKAISFFPSDISIIAKPGGKDRKAWIMDRDFKWWVSHTGFDGLLRKTFTSLPIQGSYVWKKVKGEFFPVDLRNFACEQSADNLLQATYVAEQHLMSPNEFMDMEWDEQKKDEVMEKYDNKIEKYLRIVEWRGFVPKESLGIDGKGFTRALAIVYIPDTTPQTTERGITDGTTGGVVIKFKEEKKEDFPYREFHLEKIPGRWLGVGKVEENRDPQIRTNEISNLRVKSSYFSSLNIWQTRDNTLKTNLLNDISNGDVIPVLSEITRIPNEDRNISALTDEEQGWASNRDEVANTFDVIRGERLPGNITLGAVEIAAQMSTSYFDGIRRSIASQLKPIIKNDVIGQFLAEQKGEHYVKLVGEDFDKWGDIVLAEKNTKKLLSFFFEKGKLPSKAQFEMMKAANAEKVRKGKQASVKLPKDFYKEIDYDVDIVITGQNKNVGVEAANTQMILQAIQQDETLLMDPKKRRVFARLIDNLGMNIADFETEEATGEAMDMSQMAEQKVRGGGIGGGAAGATGTGRGGQQRQMTPTEGVR